MSLKDLISENHTGIGQSYRKFLSVYEEFRQATKRNTQSKTELKKACEVLLSHKKFKDISTEQEKKEIKKVYDSIKC